MRFCSLFTFFLKDILTRHRLLEVSNNKVSVIHPSLPLLSFVAPLLSLLLSLPYPLPLLLLFPLFSFSFDTGAWTQGLIHANTVLNHQAASPPIPLFFVITWKTFFPFTWKTHEKHSSRSPGGGTCSQPSFLSGCSHTHHCLWNSVFSHTLPISSVPFLYAQLISSVTGSLFVGVGVSLILPLIGFERNSWPLVLSKVTSSSLLGFVFLSQSLVRPSCPVLCISFTSTSTRLVLQSHR